MVFKSKLPLLLFLFLFVSTLALAYQGEQDPQIQYEECQRRCQQQEGYGGQKQQQQCQQRCEETRQEQERQRGDPQQQYQQCRQQCQKQQQGQSQQEQLRCQYLCEEQLQQQQGSGSTRDPQQEYQQCRQSCQQEQGSQGQQQQRCEQLCEERRQEQESQQRDPQQQYQRCQQECKQQEQGQSQQQQRRCQQRCEEQLQQQQEQQGGNKEEQQQQQQGRNNPYFLGEESFQERFRTQHGYMGVTQRFSQLSNLLRGIENYRLGLLEANPSTFMIPRHLDADAVLFIVRGRGSINLVHQQNKESYNLEQGDVIRIPAGALIYLINRDNKDKFQIASLFQPVSTPTDRFREFFGVGGKNPESFFNSFSNEILEAAFNTPRERLDMLFGQQTKGEMVEASREQIKALTRDASSSQEGSPRRSRGPYNIFNQRPTASNEYGQLYRVDANKYRQLQDINLEVAYYNINKGAMVAPFYNSKATSLVVVVDGRGRFEMACPHLSTSQSQSQSQGQGRETQQQEGGSAHYQRVSARLSPRTAFIIPAGHPVSIVASDNQNLQIVAFKINAENNQRNYLAGQGNVLNQLEREAKELSFNVPAREVEAILNNQRQSVFLPGPNQRQQQHSEEGRHGGMSIMGFLGF